MLVDKHKKSKKKVRTAQLPTKILVAEDNLTSRKMIEMTLIRMKIGDVETVKDGLEAWQAIEADPHGYRLIVADWNMPFKTGIELLEEVRAHKIWMPFVIITGNNTMDAAIEAKERGVTAFLPKPYSSQQLARRVEEILKE